MRRVRYVFLVLLLCLSAIAAKAQRVCHPFPTVDEDYWKTALPAAMREDYIALGEQQRGKTWKAIPAALFAEYRTNGNRTRYESACFDVRRRLACLVMAEIAQGEGRFLTDIEQGLHYFMDKEPWWGLPAHYPKAQPDREVQEVDLFNAETAAMLAWTVYMLEARLPQTLADSVRSEIDRRLLTPVLRNDYGWKHNVNNWNTWITSDWLACTLLCEGDSARRKDAMAAIRKGLTLFIDGYPADGGCEEGVGYWDRAAASLFESLWLMRFAPEDERLQLNAQQNQKVQTMGRFITTMHIHDLNFVNFSDASVHNLPCINILFPYGHYLGDETMMEFAAYVGSRYNYLDHPSELFLRSGNWPVLGRELLLLSLLPEYQKTKAAQPRADEAWLANSQIMVASNDTWFLAVKGGHNGESHNHNDVGNFILYHNNQPVIIDLGRDTYTALTFSDRRYELLNNRSAYHNVPLVNGCEQAAGREHGAEQCTVSHVDSCANQYLSFAKAYPQQAYVRWLAENVSLRRKTNTVEVAYEWALDSITAPTRLTLMCYGEPKVVDAGTVALQDDSVRLHFDRRLLTAEWERVVFSDGILREQWGDRVYRLHLTLTKKALRKGKASCSFTSGR